MQPTAYSLAALALPHCPPAAIEAELRSVGAGEADDYRAAGADDGRLQGKVLLCAAESSIPSGQPPSHRRLKYGRAVTAGAAAFLYFNQNPGGLAVTGSLATRKPAPIPGLGLAYEDGATLLRLLERGPVRVRLHVTAAFPEVESANVLGDLPADPASPHGDELLLAGAHYDTHDIAPGALDNGTGVAIILEAARALAAAYRAAGRAPRRRLRFCFFAAEEIGLLGSWHYVSRHAADLSQLCFMLNVDDIGRSDPGAESLHLVGCPDLVPHLTAHAQAMHYPLTVHERLSTSSDHFPFVMHGIPAGTGGKRGITGERQRSGGPRLGPHHRRYRRQGAPRDRPIGRRSHRASAPAPRRGRTLARPPTPTRSRRSRIRRQRPPRRASPIRPLAPTLVHHYKRQLTRRRSRHQDLLPDGNRTARYYISHVYFEQHGNGGYGIVPETMNTAPVPPEHHFATKADLASIYERLGSIEGQIPHLATKADLAQVETRLLLCLGALIVALNGLTIAVLKFLG